MAIAALAPTVNGLLAKTVNNITFSLNIISSGISVSKDRIKSLPVLLMLK